MLQLEQHETINHKQPNKVKQASWYNANYCTHWYHSYFHWKDVLYQFVIWWPTRRLQMCREFLIVNFRKFIFTVSQGRGGKKEAHSKSNTGRMKMGSTQLSDLWSMSGTSVEIRSWSLGNQNWAHLPSKSPKRYHPTRTNSAFPSSCWCVLWRSLWRMWR